MCQDVESEFFLLTTKQHPSHTRGFCVVFVFSPPFYFRVVFRCVIYEFFWLISHAEPPLSNVVLKFTHTERLSLLIRKIN